jgi:hypothetical protein
MAAPTEDVYTERIDENGWGKGDDPSGPEIFESMEIRDYKLLKIKHN